MKVHHLQHVPFEGLGSIETELVNKGHQLTSTHLYAGQSLPSMENVDWLIIMGGPMSIHDEDKHPWLKEEKLFIQEAIDRDKIVLGICLGAQLIACALGAEIRRNKYKEIGWFEIRQSPEFGKSIFSHVIPEGIEVFHWHGETFEIPEGAVSLGESEACRNQGFALGTRALALQFHLETTPTSAKLLIENCRSDLDGSQYVQSEKDMLSDGERFGRINRIMSSVLKSFENNII